MFHSILTPVHSSLDDVFDPIPVYYEKIQTSLCLLVIKVISNLADGALAGTWNVVALMTDGD